MTFYGGHIDDNGVSIAIESRPFSQNFNTGRFKEFVTRMNAEIDTMAASFTINERMLEDWLIDIQEFENDLPEYWLLLVRLAEAALLCAANYADNCQFEAVGDLLANPREIVVYNLFDGSSEVKKRHGRLSDQFPIGGLHRRDWMKQFSSQTLLKTTKRPLIPHLGQVLRSSGRISTTYLKRLEECQCRIVETLTFLAAWRIPNSVELWQRLHSSSERDFVESNLCRFDSQIFNQIGICLKQSIKDPNYQSPFLSRAA
jgi:hypothetical protein